MQTSKKLRHDAAELRLFLQADGDYLLGGLVGEDDGVLVAVHRGQASFHDISVPNLTRIRRSNEGAVVRTSTGFSDIAGRTRYLDW